MEWLFFEQGLGLGDGECISIQEQDFLKGRKEHGKWLELVFFDLARARYRIDDFGEYHALCIQRREDLITDVLLILVGSGQKNFHWQLGACSAQHTQ